MAFYPTKELIDIVFGVAVAKPLTEPLVNPLKKGHIKDNGLNSEYSNSGTYLDPSTFFGNPDEDHKTPIGIFNSHRPVNNQKKGKNTPKTTENTHIVTGFADLDSLLGTLDNDSLTLIAGLPGVGKTSLSLNIAEYVGANSDMPVAFFSLDINREELLTRLVSARSKVTLDNIYSGFITSAEREGLDASLEDLYHAPIYIDDSAGHSLASIKEQVLTTKDRLGLKLIIIDCMQLIGDKNAGELSLRKIGAELKALASEISIPIITTYQLPQAWQSKKVVPHPSFILRQGAVKDYCADKVILIYRRGVCRECHCQIELCTCALDQATRLVVGHGDSQKGVAHLRFISSSVHFETPPPALTA